MRRPFSAEYMHIGATPMISVSRRRKAGLGTMIKGRRKLGYKQKSREIWTHRCGFET